MCISKKQIEIASQSLCTQTLFEIGELIPYDIGAHLSNLHRNLFFANIQDKTVSSSENTERQLTRSEKQITDLLCKGLTPKQISKKYFLSPRTVYKDMENIHQKLNVSSQQELLVKLLNKN
ncbi:MAG: helix-turn-helix transcriptional regulator [Spirochaetes bacterium]|nr:helix-turn-helix transcriptional regulator [Spirochaetota bacterium]